MPHIVLWVNRTVRLVLGLIAYAVIAFAAYIGHFSAIIDPAIERIRARKALSTTKSADLETVVGSFGTVLRFPDGAWLSIRYRDSHSFAPWSLATAYDSDGTWYESDEHFCAMLRVVSKIDAPSNKSPASAYEWIQLLNASPDLPTARQRMDSRFRRVQQ